MSSSPAFLASIDDYYLVKEDDVTLGVIETSISIEDRRAYKALTPQSVLCWVRSMVANQLATDAPSWAKTFATEARPTRVEHGMRLTHASSPRLEYAIRCMTNRRPVDMSARGAAGERHVQ